MSNFYPLGLTSISEIPFNKFPKDFTWTRFEKLCLELAQEKYKIEEIRPYGTQGDKQEGIDIYAFDPTTGKYLTIQCKREFDYTPTKIKKAVDIFFNGDFRSKSHTFILCCIDDLSKGKRQKELDKQEKRLHNEGIVFHKWDYIGLNKLLQDYPSIVGRTFGIDWVKAFNGETAYEEYSKSFKNIPKPDRIIYEYSGQYLSRTTSKLDEYKRNILNSTEHKGERLLEIIKTPYKEKNKFILLSQGGYGKSSEINFLAHYFSNEELTFFPIKVELRNFIDGKEIEYILNKSCEGWEGVPQNELLLLFDGLDEISEKEYIEFIKRVNVFSQKNKQVTILITSRTNYFNGTKGSTLFDGFEVLMLNDLTYKEIGDYIKSELGNNATAFERIVFKSNLMDLFASPFYLISTIEIYKETLTTRKFPKTKAAVIAAIVQRQFEQSEKKFAGNEFDINSNKAHLNSLLRYIAFSMTFLGRNNLLLDELQSLVTNEKDRKILKFSILEFVNGAYQFSHNLIQEFLTGEWLAGRDFEMIKDLVSFRPDFVQLKNKWLNSLSFLLSSQTITKELSDKLIAWISDIQPELLIKNMEGDKFNKDLRFKIVTSIIEKYQDKKIHIPIGEFSEDDLLKFSGVTKPMLDFCFSLLTKPDTPFETKLVAVRIFQGFDNFYGKEEKVKDLLISCIIDNEEYPLLQQNAVFALITLSRYNFTHTNVFDWFLIIKNQVRNISDLNLRDGVLHLIANQEIKKEYFDFAIESIHFLNVKSDRVRTVFEEKPIERILLKYRQPEYIKAVFELIISDKTLLKEELHKPFSFDKELISKLIENAVEAFIEDKKIFDVIIRLIERLKYRYETYQYCEIINPFFDKTKTGLRAFNHFYSKLKISIQQNIWYAVEKMVMFATKSTLKRVFGDYQKGTISDKVIITVRDMLQYSRYNKSPGLFNWFYEYINTLSNDKFVFDEKQIFDWNEHRRNQDKKNQEMLLDKELFYKEVKNVFSFAGKSKLTKDEIWDYNKSYLTDEDKMNNTLILPLLRVWAESKGYVEAETIYNGLITNEKKWKYYVTKKVALMLSSNNESIDVNERLKEFAADYLLEGLGKVDLKKAIKDTSNGYTCTVFANWLNIFINKWDIELPENRLLDLLYIDHWGAYYDEEESRPIHFVIKKVKDKNAIKERVLVNLNDNTLSKNVISSQFVLCKILDISEAKGFLYKELSGSKFSIYEKQKFLDIYIHLGGESSDLLEEYLQYTNVDYWFWDLTDNLIKEYPNEVFSKMALIMKSKKVKEEDKISASQRLLKLGKYEGIEYFCKYAKQHLKTPYDYYFTSQLNSAEGFPYKKSLDILFETLLLFFSDKETYLQQKTFERVDDTIYSLIAIVALQSDESYTYAVEKYNSFYDENYSKSIFLNHIFYPLNRLQTQYYINKEEVIEIGDLTIFYKQ